MAPSPAPSRTPASSSPAPDAGLPAGLSPREQTIRKVWAAISADPSVSIRTMAWQLAMAPSTVWLAVRELERMGYVGRSPAAGVPRPLYVRCR